MLLYGFALYPMLAALTVGTVLSFGLGTLYCWMFFIVNMILLTDCANDWQWEFYMEHVFLPSVPELICSTFLAISFPIRFVKKLIKKIRKIDIKDTQEFFEGSYQAKYVRQLLKPPIVDINDDSKPKLKERLTKKIKSMTYTKVSGFRYSPRILSTYTAGIILLFLISFQSFSNLVLAIKAALYVLGSGIDPKDNRTLDEVYDSISIAAAGNDKSGLARLLYHWFHTFLVLLCLAVTLCSIIGILQIALGLRAYREDLLNAHSGDFSKIGPRDGYSSLMVAFVRYSGYQVAYIFWAFILQFVVILLVLCVLAYVIFIPIIFGRALWFIHLLRDYWPVIAISIVISLISSLSARFIFLQKRGKIFAMNNRRLLFCVMYFLFFYNVFVGFFSCILRMLKSIAFGLFFLSRLDSSTLPKKFEKMDPGFKAYVGLIHVENAHTHPVLLTFVNMVKEIVQLQRDKDEEESKAEKEPYKKIGHSAEDVVELGANIEKKEDDNREAVEKNARRRKALQAQWFLAYTLLNNLPLRATRKHYIDAEKERLQKRFKKQAGELAVEVEDPGAENDGHGLGVELATDFKDPGAENEKNNAAFAKGLEVSTL
ncbi:receptor for retinol uptake stra6-like isoform X2 [Lineus longissimus]